MTIGQVAEVAAPKVQKSSNQGANFSQPDPSIALEYLNHLRHLGFKQADETIWKWTGTYWRAELGKDSQKFASQWLESSHPDKFSGHHINNAVSTAVIALPELDAQKLNVIPTVSGYLTVVQDDDGNHTLAKTPVNHEWNIRYCIKAELPDEARWQSAQNGLFFNFLNTILPDPKVQALVQEYIGYTLLADSRYQVAQFWIGDGANGKGTLMRIIEALHQNAVSADLSSLGGFGMEHLQGSSLVLVDEASKGGVNDQTLKSLISGDKVLLNRKFKTPVSFNCSAKFIIAGNHIPKGLDKGYGFWRRFQIVKFGVSVPKHQRDVELAKKVVASELDIVLRWAVDGLLRLLNRGYFDEPQSVEENKREVQVKSSSVLQYVEEMGRVVRSDKWTLKEVIFRDYVDWCCRANKRPHEHDEFWTQLHKECERQGVVIESKQRRTHECGYNGKVKWHANIDFVCVADDEPPEMTMTGEELFQRVMKGSWTPLDPEVDPFIN